VMKSLAVSKNDSGPIACVSQARPGPEGMAGGGPCGGGGGGGGYPDPGGGTLDMESSSR
jgi:hypothetical protein